MKTMKEYLSRALVITLIILFGEGSWIGIVSVWVELPLLVELGIPEQFGFASWMVVLIQLSNIGLIAFTLVNYFTSGRFHLEVPVNYIITGSATVLTFLLIFFWDEYSVWKIDGNLHSTALFVLIFFLSLMATTSNVAFIPFMSRFKSDLVTWYFIGMAMSGMTPSLIALVQGVGDAGTCRSNGTFVMYNETEDIRYNCTEWVAEFTSARFGPEVFFSLLFLFMFACFISYVLLNFLPIAKNEYSASYKNADRPGSRHDSETSNQGDQSTGGYDPVPDDENQEEEHKIEDVINVAVRSSNVRLAYIYFLLMLGSSLSNSILPSIQSFSAGCYSLRTFLLASTFGCMSNPIAAIVVMLKPVKSLFIVSIITFMGMVAGGYCLMTALMSPDPPLLGSKLGDALIIVSWFISLGAFSFNKSVIGWILRTEPNNRNLLIWYGVVTQFGAFLGAVIMFPLVNFTDTFLAVYRGPCDGYAECIVVQ